LGAGTNTQENGKPSYDCHMVISM